MRIEIADFVFEIKNKYSYCEQFVADYITDKEPDFFIEVSEEELLNHKARCEGRPLHYLEFLEIYRKICNFIIEKDGILMHGAVIEFDGKAYMFTAPSGTGKTTHIRLWKKLYGDRVSIINGDKPLIRYINGEFVAYGTPWCGKEHFNRNTKAPLCGIVLLSRGESNTIEHLPGDNFNRFLLRQVYMPKKSHLMTQVLEFADKMFSSVPLYHMHCNLSQEAAKVACEKITNN